MEHERNYPILTQFHHTTGRPESAGGGCHLEGAGHPERKQEPVSLQPGPQPGVPERPADQQVMRQAAGYVLVC